MWDATKARFEGKLIASINFIREKKDKNQWPKDTNEEIFKRT